MKTPKVAGLRFIQFLGAGNFGEVWLAEDEELQQPRAVKFLHREQFTDAAIDKFIAEARRMAALPRHPNRVQVHYAKRGISQCYFVMDYVDGGTLLDRMSTAGPMWWTEATGYVYDVSKALFDLHDIGLVHGDIKPDNILWEPARDQAVLTDFGLARVALTSAKSKSGIATIRENRSDDVFALAETLYYLIAGNWPPIPLEAGCLTTLIAPSRLASVIQTGLNTTPQGRPQLREFASLLHTARWSELAEKVAAKSLSTAREVRLNVRCAHCPGDQVAEFSPYPLGHAIEVRTNDLIKFTVSVDVDGYITVLLVPHDGDLSIAFPAAHHCNNALTSGRSRQFVFTLSPPSGKETFIVVWSKRNVRSDVAHWRRWLEKVSGNSAHESESQPHHVRAAHLIDTWEDPLPEGAVAAKVVKVTHYH